MATSDLAPPRGLLRSAESSSQVSAVQFTLRRVLAFVASLRLTVVLFALAIVLIFLGTLAQKDSDVWRVVNDTYFRVWFARVDFQVFERLAQLFFKTIKWDLTGGFYFFGGKTLGLCLLANLAAAHAVRFKVAAEGKRLYFGLAAIAAGVLTTYFVIRSGMNQGIESELSPAFCDYLWQGFLASLAALTLGITYVVIFSAHPPNANSLSGECSSPSTSSWPFSPCGSSPIPRPGSITPASASSGNLPRGRPPASYSSLAA